MADSKSSDWQLPDPYRENQLECIAKTLQEHCMARTPSDSDTKSFTIVLPTDAAESLEILVKRTKGSYGATRAEAAKLIILQHIRQLWESGKLPE